MSQLTSSLASQTHTVEDGINAVLRNARQSFQQSLVDCEKKVRQAPTSSMLTAAAVGYCLHHLPVRSFVVANVRLVAALMPPALFLLGAAKVYDYLQREAATPPSKK